MHRLTGGRFTLGLGRGIDAMFDAYGIPKITTAQMEDFAGLLRRLWHGEVDLRPRRPGREVPGAAPRRRRSTRTSRSVSWRSARTRSRSPAARSTWWCSTRSSPTRRRAGRRRRCGRAAEQAGRDPASVRIWSCYATVPDTIPDDLRLKKTVGRLATYLQGYGDLLVRTNGWDPDVLARFRADAVVQSVPGAIDAKADTADARAHRHAPARRVAGAGGHRQRPSTCAQRVLRQFDLGVDGVIMHGATPAELAPVVDAYRAIRPAGRFDDLAANPARALDTRAEGRIRTQNVVMASPRASGPRVEVTVGPCG